MNTNREIHTGSSTCAEFSPHSYLQLKLLSPLSHRMRNVELDTDENPWLAGAELKDQVLLEHSSLPLPITECIPTPSGYLANCTAPQYSFSAPSSLSKGLGTPAVCSSRPWALIPALTSLDWNHIFRIWSPACSHPSSSSRPQGALPTWLRVGPGGSSLC